MLALVEDRTRERRVEAVRRDFVANVSHELKTPVGAIRLLAEAVTDASDDPEAVQRFATRMLTESDRLTKLVQQIIELSRLQGHDPLETPVMVDARRRGRHRRRHQRDGGGRQGDHRSSPAASTASRSSGPRSRSAPRSATWSPTPWPTPTRARACVVTTRSEGEQVQISVVDQGIGIPAEDIDRIFERFYRVDPARHRSTGGTGLGLAIVKHVAATHGGDISVWSVQGQGSTFTLTLPRNPEPGTGPHHHARSRSSHPRGRRPTTPEPTPRRTQQETNR